MNALLPFMLLSSLVSIAGDIFCKYAAKATYPNAIWFGMCGALAWGSLPVIWVHIYRSRSILEMVVIYSSLHAFVLGIVGVVLFGDEFTLKLIAGGLLSVLAVYVMA